MLAAEARLAEELSRIAQKQGTSLYSLTNKLILAYSIIEKLGYRDPLDAAVDLVFYSNIFSTGFKITPPLIDNDNGWERLGESLWLIISMENPGIDPTRAVVRLASILIDEKNVYIDTGEDSEETRVVITVPVGSHISPDKMNKLLKGFVSEAFRGKEFEIDWKSNVVILRIKNT